MKYKTTLIVRIKDFLRAPAKVKELEHRLMCERKETVRLKEQIKAMEQPSPDKIRAAQREFVEALESSNKGIRLILQKSHKDFAKNQLKRNDELIYKYYAPNGECIAGPNDL